jgi:hypothetical protein
MKEVPHPPLLEKTATMRPFFFGVSTVCVSNSEIRSSTVRSSSLLIGIRRNSRAPARKLLRIKSGDASCAAETRAVPGHSLFKRSMNLTAWSAFGPSAMMAAAGFRRTISSMFERLAY